MTDGTQYLQYDLYTDNTYTTAVPTSGATWSFPASTGVPETVDFYGRIPAGSVLPEPGAYTDTVVVTFTY
jgi:spore coat protein U-like protein